MSRLSIIILSYNTAAVTLDCINSIIVSVQESKLDYEIIVVDNASTDDSVKMLETLKAQMPPQVTFKLCVNKKNLGYTAGNNAGLSLATGDYVLYLNSDVLLKNINFDVLIDYMNAHPAVGALSVKVVLRNNKLDMASHRGFPTVWNSFNYFAKLETLTAPIPVLNRLFGGYHLTSKDMNTIHEIDAISGAFFLSRSKLLKKLHGFDEDYFMYGEDLDLSYRIRKLGFVIVYYPLYTVLHLKYQSGLGRGDAIVKTKTKDHFYDSMKIFYRKHYERNTPWLINFLVYRFIDLKKQLS